MNDLSFNYNNFTSKSESSSEFTSEDEDEENN